MIKEIREKLIAAGRWIKAKALWLLGIIGIGTVLAITQIPVYPVEYVTAPENNAFTIGVQNYQTEFKENITEDRPLQYKLDDKFISFKPIGMKWDVDPIPHKTVKSVSKQLDKVSYKGVFGTGIDLAVNTGNRVWNKVVKIESLKDLGHIPQGAEYLEIEFEIETNFVIDGWNKHDRFEITDTVRLGDFSYIEPAMAWDSYNEIILIATTTEEGEPLDEDEWIYETLTNRVRIKSYLINKNGKLYLIKQVPIDWLKSAQYPVYTDTDIAFGDAQEFEDGTDSHIAQSVRVAEIDTNKFVVCWINGAGYDGECRVGTVSGTTITWGEISKADDIGAAATKHPIDVCKLDTNKFVAITARPTTGFYAQAVTVSTRTIGTWGTQATLSTNDIEYGHCSQLATDKFIACFNDETDSDTGKCIASTVSGTTTSPGTEEAIDDNGGDTKDYYPKYGDVAMLDTDKFIYCFEEEETGDDGYCVVGTTVGGTDITWGSNAVYTTDNPQQHGVASPDTDKFVLSFNNVTDTTGETIAGTVSTRTISYGSVVVHEGGGTSENNSVTDIDSTHVVIVYADTADGGKGKGNYSTVDWADSSVTTSTEDEFEAGDTGGGFSDAGIDTYLISSNKIVICFQDDDDLDKGKCIIGDTPSAPPAERRVIITE